MQIETQRAITEETVRIRQYLHQYPELSGQEKETKRYIKNILEHTHPDQILDDLGEQSLAAVYKGEEAGPTIVFRCDIDALPIPETTELSYKSVIEGVSHKCGHDGHTAILLGLALQLKKQKPKKGKLVLLFQSAEETGKGAGKVIQDKQWEELKPEMVFGLHNVPGFPAGHVVFKEGPFCAASKGMNIQLTGWTSHAAEPEKGRNPAYALANIILKLKQLPEQYNNEVLVTPVHALLGEKAYGVSAGSAEYNVTLRAFKNEDLDSLTEIVEKIVKEAATSEGLDFSIKYVEEFPATVNHPEASAVLKKILVDKQLDTVTLEEPFRWSEDFGCYGFTSKTCFFGMGAGEKQPPLHHPDYDFPDSIIAQGTAVFLALYSQLFF